MMFHYLSSSMIIVLLTIFVSAVTSEAFTTIKTTTITQRTNPSFLSTSSSRTNNNNNNMIFARRGINSSSLHNIPYRGGGAVKTASTSKASKASTSTSLFTAASGNDGADKCPFSKTMAIFGSVWGCFGVIYILTKAIMRVAPIAYEPFMGTSSPLPGFSTIQWSLYTLSCLFFAYAEGYKGFHLKFAPLVVKRSFTLVVGTSQGNNPINYLLAPFFSMGLFCATKRRLIISWCVSIGVAIIVALVKQLSPVPRCILDAGVVVGLSIGSVSILYHYLKSMITGKLPDIDPCLPTPK